MPANKRPPLAAVFFDLDGTLIDTAPDFAVVLNQLRTRHQLSELPYERIRATVSNGARALVTLAFGLKEGDDGFDPLRDELLALYAQHLAVKTCLFPGLADLLSWLQQRQIPWGIVTNKPRRYAEPILSALELEQSCGSLVCPDDVSKTKPDPEPILLACQQLNCSPRQCVYVGDHRRDIEAGRNANMTTIAVNYGYIEAHDPAANWLADHCVDHGQDIRPLLEKHFHIATNS